MKENKNFDPRPPSPLKKGGASYIISNLKKPLNCLCGKLPGLSDLARGFPCLFRGGANNLVTPFHNFKKSRMEGDSQNQKTGEGTRPNWGITCPLLPCTPPALSTDMILTTYTDMIPTYIYCTHIYRHHTDTYGHDIDTYRQVGWFCWFWQVPFTAGGGSLYGKPSFTRPWHKTFA